MDIKPCQFCNSTDTQLGVYKNRVFIICIGCEAKGPTVYVDDTEKLGESKKLAISNFNNREYKND